MWEPACQSEHRASQLSSVSRQRRLRHALEDEQSRQAATVSAAAAAAAVEGRQESAAVEDMVRAHRAWRLESTTERLGVLAAEKSKRAREMEAHRTRLLAMERASHEREVAQMMPAQNELTNELTS